MMSRIYQWNSADYAKHSEAQFEWARELIAKLRLRGDESVLDIGCGDGKVSAAIAGKLPQGQVLGIDSSVEMVELARQSFPNGQHVNLQFLKMDACRMELPRQFDVVFSNAALHWVRNHRPVLRRVKACLKPSGRVLLQMGGKGNAEDVFQVIDHLISQRPWSDFFAAFSFPYGFFDPEEYTALLVESGLQPVRVDLIPKDMRQNGQEGLASWVRTTWLPYTERVPAVQRDQFIEEIVSGYLKDYPLDAQNTAHVRMMRLEVEALNLSTQSCPLFT